MITTCPLTIVADDREQHPYTFAGLGDVHVVRQRLLTGDYSLPFLADRVAVSRKSLADLYGTATDHERCARFGKELERMAAMALALVVVEGLPLVDEPPDGWRPSSKSVIKSWLEWWHQLHPRITWLSIGGRRGAEIMTFAFLLNARERLEASR